MPDGIGTPTSPFDLDESGNQKNSLYCSFCGKSQHEVVKLIAGPTVFICDECVELCDEIIIEESHGERVLVRVNVPRTSEFDDALFKAISESLTEKFPGLDLRFDARGVYKSDIEIKKNIAIFSFAKMLGNDSGSATKKEEYLRLKEALAEALGRLSVLNERFIHESERARSLQSELNALKLEYLDYLRINSKSALADFEIRAVMFIDVVGFSTLSSQNKQRILDMLRGITPPLITNRGAHEVNMWGDGIVANFTDVNLAVECAVKFVRHLSVERLDARVGMAWGKIRIVQNVATGRYDIDGPVVDLAARIEAMASNGSIVLSKEFAALEVDPSIGELVPVSLPVTKAFAGHKEGDVIDLFQLRPKTN